MRMHLYKQVVEGERPVKVREGCFKLIVGDGRRGGQLAHNVKGIIDYG